MLTQLKSYINCEYNHYARKWDWKYSAMPSIIYFIFEPYINPKHSLLYLTMTYAPYSWFPYNIQRLLKIKSWKVWKSGESSTECVVTWPILK